MFVSYNHTKRYKDGGGQKSGEDAQLPWSLPIAFGGQFMHIYSIARAIAVGCGRGVRGERAE